MVVETKGSATDSARTLGVLRRLFGRVRPREFGVRLWDGSEWPPEPGHDARFTLVLNHPGALRSMLLPPGELSVAEAFIRGEFEIEGDLEAAFSLASVFVEPRPLTLLTVARYLAETRDYRNRAEMNDRLPARLEGRPHSKARDAAAISYHYDVGNEFFSLWLDRRLVYSCGYFPTGSEDIDAAQEAKLEHICRKLRLRAGERLLDIGCGWGGLIRFAAERYGVEAVGVTLSQRQAEYARALIAEAGLTTQCRVELRDYRDLKKLGLFDKVVSVGMFEHVGHAQLRRYFAAAWRALRPGGLFLNHGISTQDPATLSALARRLLLQEGAFVQRYVFPDGELVTIGEALRLAERVGFEVRDVENLREHYALTLRHWLRRLEANRDEAQRLVGETTYRVWRLHLAGAAQSFATARSGLFQSLLAKRLPDGRVPLPPTRADLYTTTML